MTDGSREGDILLVTMLLLSYGEPRQTKLWTWKVQELGGGSFIVWQWLKHWCRKNPDSVCFKSLASLWYSYGKLWDTWGLTTGHVDKEMFKNIGQIQRACVPASTLRVSASPRNGWDSTVVLDKKGEGHSFGPGMILFVCLHSRLYRQTPPSCPPQNSEDMKTETAVVWCRWRQTSEKLERK